MVHETGLGSVSTKTMGLRYIIHKAVHSDAVFALIFTVWPPRFPEHAVNQPAPQGTWSGSRCRGRSRVADRGLEEIQRTPGHKLPFTQSFTESARINAQRRPVLHPFPIGCVQRRRATAAAVCAASVQQSSPDYVVRTPERWTSDVFKRIAPCVLRSSPHVCYVRPVLKLSCSV